MHGHLQVVSDLPKPLPRNPGFKMPVATNAAGSSEPTPGTTESGVTGQPDSNSDPSTVQTTVYRSSLMPNQPVSFCELTREHLL